MCLDGASRDVCKPGIVAVELYGKFSVRKVFPKDVASHTEAAYPALAEAYVVLLTPILGQFQSQRRLCCSCMLCV